jgi:hypothetical protein
MDEQLLRYSSVQLQPQGIRLSSSLPWPMRSARDVASGQSDVRSAGTSIQLSYEPACNHVTQPMIRQQGH